MSLQRWNGLDGHFYVDGKVQVGTAWRDDDGTWTVDVNDAFHKAAGLVEADKLFIELYDPSKVNLSPMSECDGRSSPYDYCEMSENGIWTVVGPDQSEPRVATEAEAVNLVKHLHPNEMFSYVRLPPPVPSPPARRPHLRRAATPRRAEQDAARSRTRLPGPAPLPSAAA
jgi:hypothetical protein